MGGITTKQLLSRRRREARAPGTSGQGLRPRSALSYRIMVRIRALCITGLLALSNAQDRWDAPPPGPPPPRGGGQRQGKGGMVPFLASVAGGFGICKLLFGGRKLGKLKKRHKAELEAVWNELVKQRDQVISLYDDEINTHHYQLVQAASTIEQLEHILYKLPDVNGDNVISRIEFNDYMRKYKGMHPEIKDSDLPRFEDMDHDRSGQINFQEWEDYQVMAMGMQR